MILFNSLTLILAIIGAILVGYKKKEGFLVLTLYGSCVIIMGILTSYWGIVASNVILALININCYRLWSQEETKYETRTTKYFTSSRQK